MYGLLPTDLEEFDSLRFSTNRSVRRPSDYTAGVIPHHDGVAVPLEVDTVLWQR